MNGFAGKEKLPFPSMVVHPKDSQERRFSCAGWPHDSDEFVFRDVQNYLAQHISESSSGLEALFNVSKLNHWRIHFGHAVVNIGRHGLLVFRKHNGSPYAKARSAS